jgi:hypothetical protein
MTGPLIVGMRSLLIKSFGRYWADFDKTFLMPNVLHLSTLTKQGGISFSTNQRFCLHFCPKPIRMRKTLHHMKFVNKHMGLLHSFAASDFLVFAMKLIYVVLKRILLNFLLAIFD